LSLQPFPKHIRSPHITFGPEGVAHHPEIAATIARIMAGWTVIEQTTAMVAAGCLATTRIGVVAAMQSELKSSEAARVATTAIVAHCLKGTADGELFSAVMKVISQERLTRNKLAHWPMGHCEDVPTKLVVAEPQVFQQAADWAHTLWVSMRAKQMAGEDPVVDMEPLRRPETGMYVLSKRGASIILRETVRCHELVGAFWQVLLHSEMNPPRADALRRQIRSEARVQDALSRLATEGSP
jgi:hypothetical protein